MPAVDKSLLRMKAIGGDDRAKRFLAGFETAESNIKQRGAEGARSYIEDNIFVAYAAWVDGYIAGLGDAGV